MAEPKPKTVSVESIKWHTYDGVDRPIGTVYDVDEQYVETVTHLGMAIRTDRVSVAKKAEKDAQVAKDTAEKDAKAAEARTRETAVRPLTTDTHPVKHRK